VIAMNRRFISLWFPHLRTDAFALKDTSRHDRPFVLKASVHGRMIITAANIQAERRGIHAGLVLAVARALGSNLESCDDEMGLAGAVLLELAIWCVRFSPTVMVDEPEGLLMEVTGCAHLWGGEPDYVRSIESRLNAKGYGVRVGMADTPGVAWAVARFGSGTLTISPGLQEQVMAGLPPEAWRIDQEIVQRLHKLGLRKTGMFMNMSRRVLRRRFGQVLLDQLDKALGIQSEELVPVMPPSGCEERLPCMEPILTREGIMIALENLLLKLCGRLQKAQKGLRKVSLKGYRIDGQVVETGVGTSRPTCHVNHLIRLFEHKISTLDPGLGIELFVVEATVVEDAIPEQERLWEDRGGLDDERLSELIDRMVDRGGIEVSRYLPAEHYWPERSFRIADSIEEKPSSYWRTDVSRPVQVLAKPEHIEVTAPIPDYPPMLFVYRGNIHRIARAEGPERIEQEWWLQEGQHRDYYQVEDEQGARYWIFRRGHYHDKDFEWFIHGFFA